MPMETLRWKEIKMSGIDEQKVFCTCEKTNEPYWQIRLGTNIVGYINSDAYTKRRAHMTGGKHIALISDYMDKGLDEILNLMDSFSCFFCKRKIKGDHELFPRLLSMLSRYYQDEKAYLEA